MGAVFVSQRYCKFIFMGRIPRLNIQRQEFIKKAFLFIVQLIGQTAQFNQPDQGVNFGGAKFRFWQ
jgi:hypothetical protein